MAENTISHNLKGMTDLDATRSLRLIRPLSSIETLSHKSRVLAIGPRTEGELLNLVAHGFKAENVRGLDLISYSPWIDLGDMHALPYEDNSWDAVMMGWVLAYSDDRPGAASEVIRVARPGAVVAAGVEYNPLSNADIVETFGLLPGSEERIKSVQEILSLFEPNVDRIYFTHDVIPERQNEIGSICAVFSIKK